MTDLFCPIRKSWCKALPEEEVRISLIHRMVSELSFPEHTLAVEKALQQLPHIQANIKLPSRRADVLCFAKGIHPSVDLYPLLLIECKAVKITNKVIDQVVGYNHFVQAYFVCVVNKDEIRTGWRNAQGTYDFVPYLPTYDQLRQSIPGI